MALTTNQGLDIPDGSDNANVPLSFTNYNTGLENRLVQRYLSTADRTARNALPFEGELSYLADLNRYEYYTGTAWTTLIPTIVGVYEATSFAVTSLVYTTAGAPIIGASVIVPPSGIVRVGWSALMNHSVAGQATVLAPQLNTGSVVGAGATIVAAADARSAQFRGSALTIGSFTYFSGLAVGTAVNAFLMHRVTAVTGNITDRNMEIEQA